MRLSGIFAFMAAVAAMDHGPGYGGSGPYKSYYFEVESLANHTLYQPLQSTLGSSLRLPVVVWGNGGCQPRYALLTTRTGLSFRAFLSEIASHGALAIATGNIYVDPDSWTQRPFDPNNLGLNPGALTGAVDWVYANAGKGAWKHVDRTRIGVWGQSCGGLEAYAAGLDDERVGHIGVFNSGQLNESGSEGVAGRLRKPVFYLLGGEGDVAFVNGERDYGDLPRGTPAWKGNHALGHIAAFDVPNGGIPGVVGSKIVRWVLRGDAKVEKWFTGDGAYSVGIKNVTYKSLDRIKVTPIQ